MEKVVSESKNSIQIQVDFWHTSIGITIKRVAIQLAVAAAIIVADALMSESVDWHAVIYGIRFQVGYVLLSTFQTLRDPQIPNTTADTIKVRKDGNA